MSTPTEDTSQGLGILKGRRKGTATRKPSALSTPPEGPAVLPPLPESHTTMVEAVQRRTPLLLDPRQRDQLHVVEIGGHVPAARLDTDYVVSPFTASEQLLPTGCKTPISRTLWVKGQHVRRDVFATYLQAHPELAEAPPVEVGPPADESTVCAHDVTLTQACEHCPEGLAQIVATSTEEDQTSTGAPEPTPPTAV